MPSRFPPVEMRVRRRAPRLEGGVLVLAKPVCWHEQGVARDLDAYDGVLRYEKLWYLLYRYLRVSPGTT